MQKALYASTALTHWGSYQFLSQAQSSCSQRWKREVVSTRRGIRLMEVWTEMMSWMCSQIGFPQKEALDPPSLPPATSASQPLRTIQLPCCILTAPSYTREHWSLSVPVRTGMRLQVQMVSAARTSYVGFNSSSSTSLSQEPTALFWNHNWFLSVAEEQQEPLQVALPWWSYAK